MEITQQVRSVIATRLGVAESTLDDTMTMEQLGIDSLLAAELILQMEQEIDRPIDGSAVSAVVGRDTSLGELVEAIRWSFG